MGVALRLNTHYARGYSGPASAPELMIFLRKSTQSQGACALRACSRPPARAQSLLEAACARSDPLRACSCPPKEPARGRLWPPVHAQSLLGIACVLEIDAAVRACSASPLRSNLLFDDARRLCTGLGVSQLASACFRECIFMGSH